MPRRSLVLPALIAVVFFITKAALPAHAQVSGSPDAALESAVSAVTEAGLSVEQGDAVRSILEEAEREPGALWTAAGAIHAELGTTGTLAYAQALQANRIERRADRRSGRGMRGQRHSPRGPGRDADFVGPGLSDLDLTDEQQSQIAEIRSTYRQEMRALRDDAGRPSAETREAMRSLRTEMRSEIRAVLTDEQVQQIEERRSERRGQREVRRAESLEARNEVLKLNEEQKQKLDSLRSAHQQARAEMRGQRSSVDRRAHRTAGRAAIAEILDDDQEAIVTLHRALRGVMLGGDGRPRGPRGGGR
ncbi:Spy/CpxP family protein refolding chaperone [Longibacter salinarum]|nr:Spy/CpxP family protein refolding chaperone [Longibacter salinarum]